MADESSKAYLIEFSGQDMGILVTELRGYTFFASTRAAMPLDRHHFNTVPAAEKAVGELLNRHRVGLANNSRHA